MTKAKNGRKGHTEREHSGNAATTESSSAVTLTQDKGHGAECEADTEETDTECQPRQEQPLTEFNMAIRELAYYKWEAAGFPPGDGFDFWLEAEQEIKANQPDSTPAPE